MFRNLENLPWPIVNDLPPGDMDLRSKLQHLPKYVYLSDHLVELIMLAIADGDSPLFADAVREWWRPDFVLTPEGLQVRKNNRRARGRGWTGEAIHGAELKGNPNWRDMHKAGAGDQRRDTVEAGPSRKRSRRIDRDFDEDEPTHKKVRTTNNDLVGEEQSLSAWSHHTLTTSEHQDLEAWFNQGWTSIGDVGGSSDFRQQSQSFTQESHLGPSGTH